MVNCSARTGLDMLTKHYADAVGFSIVYFLPDSEGDFASYTEFLRYLGAKNRAGVAKFDDGTTLFLVPPSDFLTKVLNVAGPERLYGVVLEFPQVAPSSASVQPQYVDRQSQAASHAGYNMMPQEESALPGDYNRAVHDGVKQPFNTLGPPSSVLPINNAAVSQSGVALTPELIATLASLLPSNNKLPGPESSLGQPTTSTIGGAHVNQPRVPEQNGNLAQQFSSQFLGQAQFSQQNQTNAPANIHNISAQGVFGYSQMQDRAFNLQSQGGSRPMATAVSSQGHVAVSSHVDQHHVGVPHDPARLYSSSVLQQPTNPVTLANETNVSHVPELRAPSLALETDLSNQVQQFQTAQHGVGQETSETEEEKNRRYQTTLLFAANLLSKVQQPPGNQTGFGPGSH